jgi:D-glycero-alpha-D-manno-heptose-7-phosphate kinase
MEGESVLIRARAPLRLGLAGGGTDVPPYCNIHGGFVLNATIDRYAYAVVRETTGSDVEFIAADQKMGEVVALDRVLQEAGELRLHAAVYKRVIEQFNGGKPIPLQLTTFCDAPAGSGLGSSSTLVVAMLKAFCELLNAPLDDYDVAQMAHDIERIDCALLGGKQDQYSATFGGFNFMEFYSDRTIINPLRVKNWVLCELEASLLLYYSGVSRSSATIIEDQSRRVTEGAVQAIEAMHGLKREAVAMKECLLKADFGGLVDSMRLGWESKKNSSSIVSNPMIEKVYDAAVTAGALAGKVSGAGGGGFMMFFVPPESRLSVSRALEGFGGQISNCHFTKHGSQAWRLP